MGIGKRIKELIHDLRLSQNEFAQKLNKFPQYISDIVNDKKNYVENISVSNNAQVSNDITFMCRLSVET